MSGQITIQIASQKIASIITIQEYTFTPFNRRTQEYEDAFIAVIKFTDNFTKMTYNGRVYGITTRETYNDFDNDGDPYY